jgi:hypothetical protein
LSVKIRGLIAYLSESLETLLLGVGVDVGADDEADDVKEWHPGVLRQELLREGESDRRSDPAHLHDRHETGLDSCTDLVNRPSTRNDSHRREIDYVLDRRDLENALSVDVAAQLRTQRMGFPTIKLLTRICRILALRLVLPAKTFCRMPTRRWPNGALIKVP